MWDKKGDNLTYKWLRLLTEQQEKPVAIIAGDSQTGPSGKALESILKQNGYDVFRKYRGSWNESENTKVTSKRLSNIDLGKPVNLVVVFTGGNNSSVEFSKSATEELIQTIRNNFGKDVEIVIGAAPPARTGNPETVKKVFGRDSHPESYKARRIAMADAIATTANNMGAKAINPNTAGFLSDDTTSGDGIHLRGTDAENFAKAIASQISGKGVGVMPTTGDTKKSIRTFTGKRLSTSELRSMTAKDVVEYAKSRSSACRNMGYLSINSKGKPVTDVQKALKGKDYEIKDPEGEFGVNTLLNVIKFQIKSGIRVDGCVGPETMGALGLKDEKEKKTKVRPLMPREISGISRRHGRVPEGTLPEIVTAIKNAAEEYNVPEDVLMGAVQIESGFNPYARSYTGARGLFQFIGSTGRRYGLETDEDFYDYRKNADAGARLFKKNLEAAERVAGSLTDETEFLSYVAHNQGAGGMRQIYRSAKSGGRVKPSKTVQRNMRLQGSSVKRAMDKYPNNPAQGFLDYFKNKWNRMKDKGMNIAAAAGTPSNKEVA
jgi:hypothetical protein